jgi:SAM-dependent methyltransferase
MTNTEVKELVRNWYGGVAGGSTGCCGPTTASLGASCNMGYSEAELASLPEGADLGLGCGNPQAIAAVRPGEVVVDLGSGAGIDCFLAARQVGATGRVIGVDVTHEMLAKSRANAEKVGAANVEFRLGEIEHLPVADNTADAVISNCVVNLVPDKAQVYREAFRVLKPGGRIAIADVVNTAPLPPELASDATLLCACLAGAATMRQIEDWLTAAGFTGIRITVKPGSRELVESWAPGRGIGGYVASATIEARNPQGCPGKILRPDKGGNRPPNSSSPGHPRLRAPYTKTWMRGSSPRKTRRHFASVSQK